MLIVHSDITEPWILDLAPGHSLVAHLVASGREVFLLDWGTSATDGLADHVRTLVAAERVVIHIARARRLDLLGYCLGATIALVRAAGQPSATIRTIVAIAPPVDLAAGGKLAGFMRHRLLKPAQLLDADARVPAAYIRETFHALRPRALRSVLIGLRIRRDPSAMAYYGAMARWAWEQRPMSGAVLMDLVDAYRTNRVGADLSRIACPVFVAVADRDHIVPPASSTALVALADDVTICRVPTGHVSMVIGTGARTALWPALDAWLDARGAKQRTKRKR